MSETDMNAKDINQTYDLYAIVQSDTKLKHAGKYYVGPCPFCGGSDRFNLKQSEHGWVWLCRHCTEAKYKTSIDYIMRRDGLEFKEAVKILGGEAYRPARNQTQVEEPALRPDNPPSERWQARAMELIERAEAALWDGRGESVLAWLRARGLKDETILAARLGYIAVNYADKSENWGSPNDDLRPMYFFKGLLIPGLAGGQVWYLKMRPENPRDGQKYKHVRGGRQALYRAETLQAGKPAIFCEGELDALLLAQEVHDLARVVTLASATAELNIATWGLYLTSVSCFLFAYDMDKAGNEGAKKLAWLRDSQRLNIPQLRDGDKDLTDFHKSGGNLKSLIESALREDAPIFVHWLADMSPATIRGQYWRNSNSRIEAYYSPAQLSQCIETMRAMGA